MRAAVHTIPRPEAEFLLESLLKRKRHELYARQTTVPACVRQRFAGFVARARAGEPVQYLVRSAPFLDFSVYVDKRVLIPRPETEELVLRAAEGVSRDSMAKCEWRSASGEARVSGTRASGRRNRRPLLFLDFGTGSGCIAIALARIFSHAHVVAVDVSSDALHVCRRNAKRMGVADRVKMVCADRIDHPKLRPYRGRLSLFISNPPYVPTGRLAKLPPRVKAYEPHLALDGGPEGTSILAMLLEKGSAMLAPRGLLALEIDTTHPGLLAKYGPVVIENDLAGRPRYLFLRNDSQPVHEDSNARSPAAKT